MIALGRIGYDADAAREVVGDHGARPIIHSDYLYID